MKKLLIFLSIIIVITSCTCGPRDTVCVGHTNMIVYHCEKNTSGQESQHGIYRYYVTDATDMNWTLLSNEKYCIGDTIKIVKL